MPTSTLDEMSRVHDQSLGEGARVVRHFFDDAIAQIAMLLPCGCRSRSCRRIFCRRCFFSWLFLATAQSDRAEQKQEKKAAHGGDG